MPDYFSPFIKTIIDGKGAIRDFDITEYVEIKTAKEVTYEILDTTGEIVEDVSTMPVNRILIYTSGLITVKLEINDGVLAPYDIEMQVGGGLFSWPITGDWADFVKKIKISTASTTAISVSVKAFSV